MEISYATVREYNALRDEMPELTPVGTDLKDFQRPWVARRILQNYRSGRILEIGANRCELAEYMRKKGFEVWVVDAYDDFGGGTATFDEVRASSPKLNIHKGFFHEMESLPRDFFDVIYSCSVLEHNRLQDIEPTVERAFACLRSRGLCIHAVDFTVEPSIMPTHPLMNEILRCHHSGISAEEVREGALADMDTFYLSPQGHHTWRRFLRRNYDDYPYRRVTSLNIVSKKCP